MMRTPLGVLTSPNVARSIVSSKVKPLNHDPPPTQTEKTTSINEVATSGGELDICWDAVLGGGGFGTVYRGTLAGSSVAVKVIDHEAEQESDDSRADVAREVRAHEQLFLAEEAAAPKHLLVELLRHIEEPERSILVLPLIDGRELHDLVLEHPCGCLTEVAALGIARPLAQALAFCHAQGVAHLDIKPQNVLVAAQSSLQLDVDRIGSGGGDGSPIVRLIDYGCADLFDPNDPAEAWVDECGGTDNYMAPERHFEDDERGFLAPPADVYGLGCVFFFLLCGHPPYMWDTALTDAESAEVVRKVRAGELPFEEEDEEGRPRPPPSAAGRELIGRMTCAEPTARPAAADVVSHHWLHGEAEAGDAAEAAHGALPQQPQHDADSVQDVPDPPPQAVTRLTPKRLETVELSRTLEVLSLA